MADFMNIAPFMFQLVGQSPLRLLQAHMTLVMTAVNQLPTFFDNALKNEWDKAKEHVDIIVKQEQHADEKKRAIRLSLHKHWFTTLPRRDMLDLVMIQDQIANQAKDIVGICYGRRLMIPGVLHTTITTYVQHTVDVCEKTHELVSNLCSLIEGGLTKKASKELENMIKNISTMEHETDEEQIAIRTGIQAEEANMNPVDVIFLYDLIQRIGSLADLAQSTGNRMLLLLGP
jgi:uncharacterized protein